MVALKMGLLKKMPRNCVTCPMVKLLTDKDENVTYYVCGDPAVSNIEKAKYCFTPSEMLDASRPEFCNLVEVEDNPIKEE